MTKKSIYGISGAIFVILLVLPIIINKLTLIEAPCESFRQPSNWTIFWGTYISGIATVVLLFISWQTFIRENSPIILIDLVLLKNEACDILVFNCGKSIARNASITIDIPKSYRKIFGDKETITMEIGNIVPSQRKRVVFLRKDISEHAELSRVLNEYISKVDFYEYSYYHFDKYIMITCMYNNGEKITENISLEQAVWNKFNIANENE